MNLDYFLKWGFMYAVFPPGGHEATDDNSGCVLPPSPSAVFSSLKFLRFSSSI